MMSNHRGSDVTAMMKHCQISSTDFRIFRHGFLISKHVPDCRHGILAPGVGFGIGNGLTVCGYWGRDFDAGLSLVCCPVPAHCCTLDVDVERSFDSDFWTLDFISFSFCCAVLCITRSVPSCGAWVSVCLSSSCIVSRWLSIRCYGMRLGNRTQAFEWYHFQ